MERNPRVNESAGVPPDRQSRYHEPGKDIDEEEQERSEAEPAELLADGRGPRLGGDGVCRTWDRGHAVKPMRVDSRKDHFWNQAARKSKRSCGVVEPE